MIKKDSTVGKTPSLLFLIQVQPLEGLVRDLLVPL